MKFIKKLKSIFTRIKYILFLDKFTRDYIEFNKKKFPEIENSKVNGEVLVDLFEWKPFVFFWSILSNYLCKKKNLKIKFFYLPLYENIFEKYFFFKRPLVKIYNSFGAKLAFTSCGKKLTNDEKLYFEKEFKKFKSKEELLKYKYNGMLMGDLIYDSAIRSFQLPSLDIKDLKLKEKFLEAHLYYKIISKYLDNNNVKFLIPSDCVYNQYGIITRLCDERDIEVLILYNLGRGMTDFKLTRYNSKIKSNRNPYNSYKKDFNNKFKDEKKRKEVLAIGKKLILNRVKGKNKKGIQYLNSNPFINNKFAKNNLFEKNSFQVAIILHNFFDAPHKYRNLHYFDYLDWATDTINILDKKKINTYIKFHPINIGKSADDIAFRKIEKQIQRKQNFKILDKNTSYADLIKNNLKAAITCHGTVANELPFFGLKIINCGDNPHINYNFNIHPRSRHEYKNYIENIENLHVNINLYELYEFYFMNYYFYEQNNFKNKLKQSYLVKNNKDLRNEENIHFNDSANYYDFIISENNRSNIVDKLNAYINEYFTNT